MANGKVSQMIPTSEGSLLYVEGLSDARTQLWRVKLLPSAEVVKWQTRTFEGRVAQAVRVQVPPSAPNQTRA